MHKTSKDFPIVKVRFLNLELTNVCNLSCSFCANHKMTRPRGHMDINLAKQIIDDVKKHSICEYITTNVMGEPLLYTHVDEFFEYANAKKQAIELITNGTLLDQKRSRQVLTVYQPGLVSISYHAGVQESCGPDFIVPDSQCYKKTIFDFVEQKFALKSKVPINISLFSTYWQQNQLFKVLNSRESINELSREWLDFSRRLRKKYKIPWLVPDRIYSGANMLLPDLNLSFYPTYHTWTKEIIPDPEIHLEEHPRQLCWSAFEQFNVLWNGDTTLCCWDYNGDLVYDSLVNKSFYEVFNSSKIQEIRDHFFTRCGMALKCRKCLCELKKPFVYNIHAPDALEMVKLKGDEVIKQSMHRFMRIGWKIISGKAFAEAKDLHYRSLLEKKLKDFDVFKHK